MFRRRRRRGWPRGDSRTTRARSAVRSPSVGAMIELPVVGAGGEPVDLWRTIVSHGVASLPPAEVDEDARTMEITLPVSAGARTVRISEGGAGRAKLELLGRAGPRQVERLTEAVRHILRLDEDLSAFYKLAANDPEL